MTKIKNLLLIYLYCFLHLFTTFFKFIWIFSSHFFLLYLFIFIFICYLYLFAIYIYLLYSIRFPIHLQTILLRIEFPKTNVADSSVSPTCGNYAAQFSLFPYFAAQLTFSFVVLLYDVFTYNDDGSSLYWCVCVWLWLWVKKFFNKNKRKKEKSVCLIEKKLCVLGHFCVC